MPIPRGFALQGNVTTATSGTNSYVVTFPLMDDGRLVITDFDAVNQSAVSAATDMNIVAGLQDNVATGVIVREFGSNSGTTGVVVCSVSWTGEQMFAGSQVQFFVNSFGPSSTFVQFNIRGYLI